MLKLHLHQDSLTLIKNFLESVNDLFVDANFDCSSSSFAVQAMDSSLTAFMLLHLKSEAFQQYQCDRDMSIGINLNNMAKVLQGAQKDDTVILEAVNGGSTATFVFKSPTKDKILDFEMKLIHSQHLGMSYPKCHHAVVTMPSAPFTRICKYLSSIGDTVVISITNEGLKLSTKGDKGAANFVCKQNITVKPENSTIIEMNEPVSLTVALTYLNSFTKATVLSDTVTICLTSELPVIVDYKIDDKGYIRFYVEPKIDDLARKIEGDYEDDEGGTT